MIYNLSTHVPNLCTYLPFPFPLPLPLPLPPTLTPHTFPSPFPLSPFPPQALTMRRHKLWVVMSKKEVGRCQKSIASFRKEVLQNCKRMATGCMRVCRQKALQVCKCVCVVVCRCVSVCVVVCGCVSVCGGV